MVPDFTLQNTVFFTCFIQDILRKAQEGVQKTYKLENVECFDENYKFREGYVKVRWRKT